MTDTSGAGGEEASAVGGMAGSAGGRLRRGAGRILNAVGVGGRVNVEGVRAITTEFDTLLKKLQQVRTEMQAINGLQASVGGGSAAGGGTTPTSGMTTGVGTSNPSLAKFSSMSNRWASMGGIGGATVVGLTALAGAGNAVGSRFNRNLAESIPISQGNMLLSSQYSGLSYGTMERQRVAALGRFNFSRADTAAAQATGLRYGQSASQTSTFLQQTVAPLVQASGGTMTPGQAAASASTFLSPMTERRAIGMGIGAGKIAGQVQNPLTTAMGYIQAFQRMNNVTMNDIDFQNMMSPGSRTRYQFKRLYALTDEAIDTIIQAGLQNYKFTGGRAGAKSIDFASSQDLQAIGMSNSRLGMAAYKYMSAGVNREANFAAQQEGAQVGRLGVDTNIENILSKVEDALGGVIGPLGEFGQVIHTATGALQGLLGIMLMRSVMGGGGGLLGGARGVAGGVKGIGSGAATGAEGTAAGIAGPSAFGAAVPGVLAGGALMIGGNMLGNRVGGVGGTAISVGADIGGAALAGGAIGTALGGPVIGTAIGAAAGTLIGGAKALMDSGKRSAADVRNATAEAMGLSEAQLIRGMANVRSGASFGPKETARYDVWQTRRGALVADLLKRMHDETTAFDHVPTQVAAEIANEFSFFSSSSVTNDDKFNARKNAFMKQVMPLIQRYPDAKKIYMELFGNSVTSPFDMAHAINTPEANAMVTTGTSVLDDTFGVKNAATSGGDPIIDRENADSSWSGLDPRMKERLTKMFEASGGKVYVMKGGGTRTEAQQKAMFLSRYTPDPNSNDATYEGRTYRHTSGAAAAPPGKSMHEIGLAADLAGDLNWVQTHAGEFGLKTFAGVNNEPWHVQLQELPNSRSQYEKGGGAGGTASATTADYVGDSGASSTTGGGAWGGSAVAYSGVNFNLANAGPGRGGWGGGAVSSTAASIATGGSGAMTTTAAAVGAVLTAQQVAKYAYDAGFRGTDLTDVVAIAMRESHGKTTAYNPNASTGDLSYGLMQINMKGTLGPANLKRFGISTNEQLFDPTTNMRAAYKLYQDNSNTLRPWGGYKGKSNTYGADVSGAAAAVSAAGLGGGDPMGGGGSTIHIASLNLNVAMKATGVLQYDANQFAAVAATKLQEQLDLASRRAGT